MQPRLESEMCGDCSGNTSSSISPLQQKEGRMIGLFAPECSADSGTEHGKYASQGRPGKAESQSLNPRPEFRNKTE